MPVLLAATIGLTVALSPFRQECRPFHCYHEFLRTDFRIGLDDPGVVRHVIQEAPEFLRLQSGANPPGCVGTLWENKRIHFAIHQACKLELRGAKQDLMLVVEACWGKRTASLALEAYGALEALGMEYEYFIGQASRMDFWPYRSEMAFRILAANPDPVSLGLARSFQESFRRPVNCRNPRYSDHLRVANAAYAAVWRTNQYQGRHDELLRLGDAPALYQLLIPWVIRGASHSGDHTAPVRKYQPIPRWAKRMMRIQLREDPEGVLRKLSEMQWTDFTGKPIVDAPINAIEVADNWRGEFCLKMDLDGPWTYDPGLMHIYPGTPGPKPR